MLEESRGFTEWVRRNGRADYSMYDFVQINATGLLLTIGATLAVTRRPERGLFAAYCAVVLTQQALFNPVFHVGSTVAYRDWSPGTASAVVLFPPLWWHVTRRVLRDRILGVGGMSVGIAVGGAVAFPSLVSGWARVIAKPALTSHDVPARSRCCGELATRTFGVQGPRTGMHDTTGAGTPRGRRLSIAAGDAAGAGVDVDTLGPFPARHRGSTIRPSRITQLREGTMDASELGNRSWRSPTAAARRFRRLAAAAAVTVLVLAFALVSSASRDDEVSVERPGAALRLTYRVEPVGGAVAERTAQVLRERLSAAGVDDAQVRVSASAGLTVTAAARAGADVTALVERGRVALYDWEGSVLGPRGAPAPADPDVTGGSGAGHAAAITRAEAETRAAARPGGRVVRAEGRPDGWFALAGKPAMTDVDIASAGSGLDPGSQQPIVTIEFTPRGQGAFTTLTRNLAHRASTRAADGVSNMEADQHFAIVIDDRIVAVPYIDFRAAPDGIDGATGAQIQGGLMPHTARRTAAILTTGPLPAALSNPTGPPVSNRHP